MGIYLMPSTVKKKIFTLTTIIFSLRKRDELSQGNTFNEYQSLTERPCTLWLYYTANKWGRVGCSYWRKKRQLWKWSDYRSYKWKCNCWFLSKLLLWVWDWMHLKHEFVRLKIKAKKVSKIKYKVFYKVEDLQK